MARRENTFRVDYSQFPKHLSHEEIHKFVAKELGLTRENVLQLQPSRRLGCTFVKVINLELAENIVEQHDGKHEFEFDGKAYKVRIKMEDGAVEVRLLDLPDGVSNGQIAEFLADYGEVISVRDLLWDDRYSDFGGIKTGVRIARMVVTKNIPSLVTIHGEETAVGYKGQRQTCLHCHEFTHIGIPCVQNKKLLVQKLAADLSYASVTKRKPSKPQPLKPSSAARKPSSGLAIRLTRGTEQQGMSGLKQSLVGANESPSAMVQQKNTMQPPAVPATTNPTATQTIILPNDILLSLNKSDGTDTDSSAISSNSIRRSRRIPPGKKMRYPGESTTTHAISDDEMQQ